MFAAQGAGFKPYNEIVELLLNNNPDIKFDDYLKSMFPGLVYNYGNFPIHGFWNYFVFTFQTVYNNMEKKIIPARFMKLFWLLK